MPALEGTGINIMKKLFAQIIKFGFVGGLCFLIDFVITMIVNHVLHAVTGMAFETTATVAGFFGFTISVIVNYILSMKFVFERKEDMSKKKEFIIFLILSIIGLGINEVVIWFCTGVLYKDIQWLQETFNNTVYLAGAKILATAIVMVYNFVSRKIFLEKH